MLKINHQNNHATIRNQIQWIAEATSDQKYLIHIQWQNQPAEQLDMKSPYFYNLS